MPQMEQDNLYRQWNLGLSYYQQTPLARTSGIKNYFCPSRRTAADSFNGSVFGGARVLFADGHVRELADGFDPAILRAMFTADGGESIHVEGEKWIMKGGGR